jgi:hypothetical protein
MIVLLLLTGGFIGLNLKVFHTRVMYRGEMCTVHGIGFPWFIANYGVPDSALTHPENWNVETDISDEALLAFYGKNFDAASKKL